MRGLDDILLLFIVFLLFDNLKLSSKNLPKAIMMTMLGQDKLPFGNEKPQNSETGSADNNKKANEEGKTVNSQRATSENTEPKIKNQSNIEADGKNMDNFKETAESFLKGNPSKGDIMGKIMELTANEDPKNIARIANMAKQFTEGFNKKDTGGNTVNTASSNPQINLLRALKPFCSSEQGSIIETVSGFTETLSVLERMDGGI